MKNTKIIFLFLAIILLMSLFNCTMPQQEEKKNEVSSTENLKPDSELNKIIPPIVLTYKTRLELLRHSFGSNIIIAIAGGYEHSLALAKDGTVWVTGANYCGQLGLGDKINRTVWTKTGLKNITAIACGELHSLALKDDGTLWATGLNRDGQLGISNAGEYVDVWKNTGLKNITAIACGGYHSLALKSDGSVLAAGDNRRGQLGQGDDIDYLYAWSATCPRNIIITAIACGRSHSLVLTNDKTVWATGDNFYGQLGLGSNRNSYYIWKNTGLNNITAIACGYNYSLALKDVNNGRVYATGWNASGQLGLGDNEERNIWTRTNAYDVKAIACGNDHSLVISNNDERVWLTGSNDFGQLGFGDYYDRNKWTKTNVKNAEAIACGCFYSLALVSGGRVWATGDGCDSQFGLGDYLSNINEFTYSSFIYTGPTVIFNEYSERFIGSGGTGNGAGVHTTVSLEGLDLTNKTQLKKIAYKIIYAEDGYVLIKHCHSTRYLYSEDNKKIILGDKNANKSNKAYQFKIEWLGDGSWARIKHRGSNKYLFSGKNTADPLLLFRSIDDDDPELGFNFFVDRIFDL